MEHLEFIACEYNRINNEKDPELSKNFYLLFYLPIIVEIKDYFLALIYFTIYLFNFLFLKNLKSCIL